MSAVARSPAGHTFCRAAVALLKLLRSMTDDSPATEAERHALVLACVMHCCAWLEGYANDVCERSGDEDGRHNSNWLPTVKNRELVTFTHRAWDLGLNPRGQNAVERWCALFEQLGLQLDVPQGADVRLLVKLRNALIHAAPGRASYDGQVWVTEGEWSKLEPKLAQRFPISNTLFPRALLTLGCAEWAFKTAHSFANQVNAGLGMPDPFADHLR